MSSCRATNAKAGELDVTRVGTLGQIRVSQQALDRYIEQSSDGAPLSATASDASNSRSGRQPEVKPTPSASSMPPVRETAGTAPNGAAWRILNGDVRAALERMMGSDVKTAKPKTDSSLVKRVRRTKP